MLPECVPAAPPPGEHGLPAPLLLPNAAVAGAHTPPCQLHLTPQTHLAAASAAAASAPAAAASAPAAVVATAPAVSVANTPAAVATLHAVAVAAAADLMAAAHDAGGFASYPALMLEAVLLTEER